MKQKIIKTLTKNLGIFFLLFFAIVFGLTSHTNAQGSYWKNYFSSGEQKAIEKNSESYTLSQIESKSGKWKGIIRGYNIKNGSIDDEDIKDNGISTDKISGLDEYIDQRISGNSIPQDFAADRLTGSYAALNGSQITNLSPTNITGSGNLNIGNGDLFVNDTSGNVGIGTILPTSRFMVDGSIVATESLTANNVYQNNLQVASARLSYRDLLFYDDFNRADTAVGELGVSTSGHTYDMRGVSAQEGNAVTNIQNSKWVSEAGDITYAIQTLPVNVTRMGGRVSWVNGNGGSDPGAFAMLVSPDKAGSNLYLNAGAHIIITRSQWIIQYINNGSFVTIKSGTFSPALSTDGRSYPFEITINGPTLYYSFAGTTGNASSSYFDTLSGPYVTWEHYYNSSSVSDLVRIEAVWAGTNSAASSNIYDLSSSGSVGVGTKTPTAKIDIKGSASNTISARNFLRFSNDVGSFIQQGLNASGDLSIDNIYGSELNLMTVNRNGLIGIGTTDPKTKLEVDGIIKTKERATATCNADAKGGIYFDSDDNHFYGCNGTAWVQLDN
ncbi:MAG: hypothetical protein WAV16_03875 [Candidatus Moraniibacteriota bacterium]